MNDPTLPKGFAGLDALVSDVTRVNSLTEDVESRPKPAVASPSPPIANKQEPSAVALPEPPSSNDNSVKILFWLIGIALLVAFAVNYDSDERPRQRPQVNAEPPTDTPTQSNRPITPAKPVMPTMSRPSVGRNNVLSISEIRWCVAEEIGLDALPKQPGSDQLVDRVNRQVNDYNSRCGEYRYREGSLTRAKREIEPFRAAIETTILVEYGLKSPNLASPLVRSVQEGLLALGYAPGGADGLIGERTESAIYEFERHLGMPSSGRVTEELLELLELVIEKIGLDPRGSQGIIIAVSNATGFENEATAIFWFADMSRRLASTVTDSEERAELLLAINRAATQSGLEAELVLAVIDVASGFDQMAISVEGHVGLMRIAPFWRDEIGRPDDNLINIATNLRYGCTILKYHLDKENGDLRRALAASYPNADEEFVRRVISTLRDRWFIG